jgi:hypothetical protein
LTGTISDERRQMTEWRGARSALLLVGSRLGTETKRQEQTTRRTDRADRQIAFTVRGTLARDVLDNSSLHGNNRPIELTRHEATGTQFSGVIPRESLGCERGDATLTLIVEKTAAPHNLNPDSHEKRLLGFALSALRIE